MAARAQTGSSVPPAARGSESLGKQLLDDLKSNHPQKPAALKPGQESALRGEKTSQPATPRFDDLGEDIGQSSGLLPLVRVRQGMQRAESLLGEPSVSSNGGAIEKAANVQADIIAQLDQLIAELSKQCQSGQCQPGSQPPNPSQQSQAKPGDSTGSVAQGQTAARDSTDRLNAASAKPVDKGDIDELAKQLWGHLPQRTREQMLQSFSEDFLPKYQREIEEYYRRLSEEQKSEPQQQ
ncbi:MAG TPA: hypothetical protein VHK01_16355 [Lacipirellulaceae bacterium]|nr:hypothetical protein [Lacipirellulaceae bacterium]